MQLPAGFDLDTLGTFVAVAEQRGMSPAARSLRTTQSAVSQAIARLERAVGAALFDRRLRPLALTPDGELLLVRSRALLATSRGVLDEVRHRTGQPFERVSIAMAESLAHHLTVPLLENFGASARHWQLRSGISLLQHDDFAARKLDILITSSSPIEPQRGFEVHRVIDEEFVVIAPASYDGPIDDPGALAAQPFIRFSLLSGMGQRIEHQLGRLKLDLPRRLEVDSIWQQVSCVGAGLGWSLTTPLCLVSHLRLLPRLRVARMRHAAFRREIRVVARAGEFQALPARIATAARAALIDAIDAGAATVPMLAETVRAAAVAGPAGSHAR